MELWCCGFGFEVCGLERETDGAGYLGFGTEGADKKPGLHADASFFENNSHRIAQRGMNADPAAEDEERAIHDQRDVVYRVSDSSGSTVEDLLSQWIALERAVEDLCCGQAADGEGGSMAGNGLPAGLDSRG